MSRFSPSDAALEGFRITRAHPLAVLAWIGLRLAFGILSIAMMASGDFAATSLAISAESHAAIPDSAKVLALFSHILPTMLVMIFAVMAFYAVAYTAVLRAVLRPADKAFLYLRLSMDEVRQFLLGLMIFVIFLLYVCVVNIIATSLIQGAKALGGAALLVQILVVMGMIAALVYPAVRLSMAPALTFVEGRITLFRAWPLTQGQFWAVLGTFVLALVLAVVVSLLAMVIFVFAVGALGAAQHGLSDIRDVFGVMQTKAMTLASLTDPIAVAQLVFGAFLNTLDAVILFAPGAAIFRVLIGARAAQGREPAAAATPGKPWG